ncbi:PKD domain-containing protein [Kitasatospora terrestris]|uniref:PKD domain-containing protein n=1 Tax=Kitasatospora terrestris TaxID=258051 RepID=A0ABP9DJT8_9ACTN
MRLRQSAALTVAAATSVLAFPAVQASAETAGSTLYVNRAATSCTDAGSGSEANPYCTISAAAAAVRPGQTVKVAPDSGPYRETVTVTRSGTPEQPITFLGVPYDARGTRPMLNPPAADAGGFVLVGVHDVTVRGFLVRGDAATSVPLVSVRDSSRVTVDQSLFTLTKAPSIQVSGPGGDLTFARNRFYNTGGLAVGAGAHDVLITANEFNRTTSAAVTAVDAPRTAVTGNTIAFSCAESVRIDGASPGAVVENNVITAVHDPATDTAAPCATDRATRGEAEIAVAAGSVSGSKVDYNLVHPWSDGSAYAWAGTAYPSAAAFAAAQPGQAGHDVDVDVAFGQPATADLRLTEAAAAAIDSTDPTAPGIATDLLGIKPGDDPKIAGTGPGIRDRGAYELFGQRRVDLAVTAGVTTPQGPAPFTVTATATAYNAWGVKQAVYHFDFGDGTTADSTAPALSHTYTAPGTYHAEVTATDAQGASVTSASQQVDVRPAADLTADVSVTTGASFGVTVAVNASSPYALSLVYLIDFGDGSGNLPVLDWKDAHHQYRVPGRYEIAVTVTDQAKRSTVVRRTVQVADAGYEASLAPGERVQLFAMTKESYAPVNTGANYSRGLWAPFQPVPTLGLGGGAPSTVTAAVVTEDQHLRSFVRTEDGRVFYADRNLGPFDGYLNPGDWTEWLELTSPDTAGPLPGITSLTATAIGNDIHLVAVAGGRVHETSLGRIGWKWSRWGDITGALGYPGDVSSAAAASIGNVLHVAMLSTDGRIRVADGDYGRGRWSGGDLTAAVGRLPGTTTQLAAAATPGSKFHIVALASGKVYEAGGDYAAGRWSNWGDITAESGLPALTKVAAAATGNTLRVFGLSVSGGIVNADGDYTLGRWTRASSVNAAGAAGPVDPFSYRQVTDLSAAGR